MKRDEATIWNAVYSHAYVALLTKPRDMFSAISRAEAARTAASLADDAVHNLPVVMVIERTVAAKPENAHAPGDAADPQR